MQTHGNVSSMVVAALTATSIDREVVDTIPVTELYIAFFVVVESVLGAPLLSEVPLWGTLVQGQSDGLHPKVPPHESDRD